ncbi:hypothetical protein ACFL2H_13075, partial [Planctomycetota bacterium]
PVHQAAFQVSQHAIAMQIAEKFRIIPSGKTFVTAGHSLGGGLASAASVVGGFKGYTFNGTGLHADTLLERDANGDPIPGQFEYAMSEQNFNNAATMIDAYYMDWDILTLAQDNSPGFMPSAIGERHPLDGPYDADIGLTFTFAAVNKALGFGWWLTALEATLVAETLVKSHYRSFSAHLGCNIR